MEMANGKWKMELLFKPLKSSPCCASFQTFHLSDLSLSLSLSLNSLEEQHPVHPIESEALQGDHGM